MSDLYNNSSVMTNTNENHNLKLKYYNVTIQKEEKKLADFLFQEYKDKNPIFLIVLKGGMTFATDLMKYFPFHFRYRIKTVSASTYKSETSPVNKVDLTFVDAPNYDWAKDEYVVVLDDVADTFNTLNAIKKSYSLKNVKELKTCVLIEKPFRREISELPDYYAISYLDTGFLVGYGMGLDDLYRGLPNIYELSIN